MKVEVEGSGFVSGLGPKARQDHRWGRIVVLARAEATLLVRLLSLEGFCLCRSDSPSL